MPNKNIDELIARIMSDERVRKNSHLSEKIYADEPLLTTGRQMASYLPPEYEKMRAISRWQPGENGQPGRWLTEAELFYRQGMLMANFGDDCPYHGNFKSYYPTYNAMSDRQLRGYFTWRAAVRQGKIQQAPTSFVFVYVYELLNGIGVASPADGYQKIWAFWQAYAPHEPELDRFVRVWLKDYVVYHGLPRELLAQSKTVLFDQAIAQLQAAQGTLAKRAALTPRGEEAEEERLFAALDELSAYRLGASKLNAEHHAALRHVACGVYARMAAYYEKSRKKGLVETFFGSEATMPYTMFGSAVFFEERKHADCEYELNSTHRYRCKRGFWECTRIQGNRARSEKLGGIMRAVDASLREELGFEPGLSVEKTPKYLQKFIDEEIEAWRGWQQAEAARHIEIDLGALAGIRQAAESTRESLLIDEEREGGAGLEAKPAEPQQAAAPAQPTQPQQTPPPIAHAEPPRGPKEGRTAAPCEGTDAAAAENAPGSPLLTPEQAAFLRALLAGAPPPPTNGSEDLLVDAINEALYDEIGDTVLEYTPTGPAIIEDYQDELKGLLGHD